MKLSPKFKIGIIIILLIALFAILNLTPAKKETKNFFYLISSPVQKTFWRAGMETSDFFEMISEMKNLKKENEELKLRIQELISENISLKELKKENEILRQALKIGLQEEFKLEFSQVTGIDISGDTILINKGLKDGVSKDLSVITEQKTLVGRISEVYKNFSKVQLITYKGISFAAEIEDYNQGTPILGEMKGKGNLKLFLDRLPQEREIKKGDIVITTALGGIFPKGLLVGEIQEIFKSDIEPWQQAEVKPAFDIKELETLFIILEF